MYIEIVAVEVMVLPPCGLDCLCVCFFVFVLFFSFFTFDRVHPIYMVFHSRGFYDVPRVLIADSRSFQALAAILDSVTHLATMSCWYRSDARQVEVRLV